MKPIDLERRTIGVNICAEGDVEVCVWAPEADKIELVLTNGNAVALQKTEYGYWEELHSNLKTGDRYKFRIDGNDALPDPASLSQPEGVHGHSEVIDLGHFNWTDNKWKNPVLSDYIIYELHTGAFSPHGNFKGIEEKLDYLVELGITAVEIMPVAQFPGGRNWGYDGVYSFAVQDSYGGAKGLQKFVDACHRKGLAVVLDVVYNHMGPEGNYLRNFGPYFTNKYHTPWGDAINFDDAWSDEVRRFFIENVLMWFRDFHIDALRMDAVHAIRDFGAKHILKEIREYTDQLMKLTEHTHYLIVESDLNDTRLIDPIERYGYRMDAQWIDEFHHSLRVATGQKKHGYYADFDGLPHLAKSFKSAYVYDGIYSTERKRTFGNKTDKNPASQFVVFSQNHDQVGNRMLGERTSQLVSFEMLKLMAGAVLVSPFIPLIFMGEEYGEPNPFLYFVSHTEPDLIETVRNGRKAEFKDFHAQGEAPDPQDEETFRRSKLQWDLLHVSKHSVLFKYYKALIRLRKNNYVLSHLDKNDLDVNVTNQRQVLNIHRYKGSEQLLCILNFSAKKQTVAPAADKKWHKLFDSATPEWNGPAASLASITSGDELTLHPESILIYSHNV